MNKRLSDKNVPFDALFYHAAMGIVMINKNSEILLVNRFAEMLFGYNHNELVGINLEVLLPDDAREKHKEQHISYINAPKIRPMGTGLTLQAKHKDGSLFPVEISLSFFEEKGETFFLSFIHDITFKKQAEEELIRQKKEIEKLNQNLENQVVTRTRALVETMKNLEESKQDLEVLLSKERELGILKSRFVSMASHEFRTPLSTILSSATLIEKYPQGDDQEKREKHINRIKSAVGNLTDILEEFLSVGKLEEGKIEPRPTEFDITELISDTTSDIKNMLKNGQSFEYQHLGKLDVYLDKSLFRKILINLCSNAIKFSPENAIINIETELTKNSLTLIVRDNGIGISEEDQKHLFERFFRAGNVTNIQGTGLGLHIVAKYTELLNGKVSIISKLNEGTKVKIRFHFEE